MNSRDKAQQGLNLIKSSILELLAENPNGLRNIDIASKLDLRSDYLGKNQDYLTWSILGLLLNEKKIKKEGKKYFVIA